MGNSVMELPKSEWGVGPWTDEPDRDEWTHAGLPCFARRGPSFSGHWCAYVGVPKGHVLYGKGYSDELPELVEALKDREAQPVGQNPSFAVMLACIFGKLTATPEIVFSVHGGLTYAGKRIDGAANDHWWFGFDCAHCDDFQPAFHARYKDHGYPFDSGDYDPALAGVDGRPVYRTLAYVRAEANRLAEQLAAVASHGAAQ